MNKLEALIYHEGFHPQLSEMCHVQYYWVSRPVLNFPGKPDRAEKRKWATSVPCGIERGLKRALI